jgi:hypothetical protein
MASNGGSSAYRNVPDVALTANNVYLLFGNGSSETVGGTSCAAPLWAAFTALVNQQNEAEGQPPAGFLNPALYAIGLGTNYNACFHDITTGNNTWPDSPNYFYAVNGYDLCTGWGTPAGSNLINVLAAPADALEITPLNGFSASAAPGGPVKVVSQSFVLTNAGTTALDWVLDNPAAWLSNSPSGGTLPAGGSVNVTVSLDATAVAALPAGVYPTNIWFTNVSDGVAQSRQFTLTLAVPQLVQNGGFETGDFTGWTVTGSSGSDDVFVGSADSLAVTTGYGRHKITTYYGSYYIHSGSYAAFLGEPDVLSYLSQNLATDPGQAYLLSFWVDNPGKFVNPPTPNEFMAAWNGNTLLDQVNMGAFSYTNLQFTVEATNASTTLEFGARNDNDYFGLDDISVTPIPTPAFQSAASVGGSITLTWAAMTGVTYQLQYTASLSAPNWSNLGPPITASNGVIATSDNQPADSQRFYRVVLAP